MSYVLAKPFLGKPKGFSRAVEHEDMKSAAVDMTQLADAALEHAIRKSRAERARIQAQAEGQ